jgi:putative ABC transport system permease protein
VKRRFGKKPWPELLEQEIYEYIERETEDNIARGMSAEDARVAALRKLGNITRVKEDTRAIWEKIWLEQLMQDIGYGLRILKRNLGFTTAVILTLALGIGMNTAMFSVVDAVFLRHVPYPDADRLIWIAGYDTGYESDVDHRLLPSDYSAFRQQTSSFESMAGYSNEDLAMVYRSESEAERIASITGDFWSMTGAQPAFGRLLKTGEAHAMVLSWHLFERRFQSDPQVIGKTVTVDDHQFQIVGVLPASFRLLFPQFLYADDERRDIDAYIAIPNEALDLPISAYRIGNWDKISQKLGPTPGFVWTVGTLKPDAPLTRAQAEIEAIYQRRIKDQPGVYHTHSALRIQRLQTKLVGNVRPAFLVLGGAVGFVLLIVCANVANLLLARASARQKEVAIRRALGAGRSRLMQQFLTESLFLALGGALAGAAFATGITAVIVRLGSAALPRLSAATTNVRVLLFTLAIGLVTAVLFGFGPSASLLKDDVPSSLKEEGATSSAGAGRLRVRAALVAIEVSLAMVLLSGAGLMLKSFWHMNDFPPGFSPDKIVVMNISLSGAEYRTWPQQHAYLEELFRRLGSVPRVQAKGIHCSTFNTSIQVQGRISEAPTFAAIEYVSPGYLQAMGVPLLEGTWPTEDQAIDRVIINQSFARRVASGGSLIGRQIHAALLSATIAGIVPDFKTSKLDAEPGPAVYAAYQMSPRISFITAAVRVASNPAAVMPGIRKLVSSIDENVPAYHLETLQSALADSIAPRRFNMFLLSSFAAAAVLLSLIGIYGIIAYLVAQRTREIGIRLALGAQRLEVVGMVIRQGLTIIVAGVLTGLLAALALGRLMISLLYGVRPNDLSTLLAVAVALMVIALLACWGPALRAARVDPIVALRHE